MIFRQLDDVDTEYFLNRDFFKRRFEGGDSTRVQIPLNSFESMELSKDQKVDVVVLHPMFDRPIFTEPRPIREKRRITIPSKDWPLEETNPPGIFQFVIGNPGYSGGLNPRALYASRDQLFSRAIFKNQVSFSGREYQEQVQVNIPSQEIDMTGIESGDMVNVFAINLSKISGISKKRRPFRTRVYEHEAGHGTTVLFNVPERLSRLRGYEEGDWIQYIVRKARVG